MCTNTNVSAQTVKQAASPPATGYVPWPIEESSRSPFNGPSSTTWHREASPTDLSGDTRSTDMGIPPSPPCDGLDDVLLRRGVEHLGD